MRITRECNEESKLVIFTYQCQSILLFRFHESRFFYVIEKQYDNFLVNIFKLDLFTQSIHNVKVKINS